MRYFHLKAISLSAQIIMEAGTQQQQLDLVASYRAYQSGT
jgi:hypothetical protein